MEQFHGTTIVSVRREVVVFWSPLDVFILGLGTLIFGTIDRVRTVGAGLVGAGSRQSRIVTDLAGLLDLWGLAGLSAPRWQLPAGAPLLR